MSKILANQIANYGDNAPIEIKEGLNIPAGKPIQAAGVAGNSGQVLTSTGTSISWTTPFSGSYNDLTNKPTIPAAQVKSDWNAIGTVAEILNKPVIPPQPSLVVNAAGTPSLTYNSVNGQFTYTPPDLSNYDTAYGWGDHAAAGYVTSSAISEYGYITAESDTLSSVVSRGNTTTNTIGVGGITTPLMNFNVNSFTNSFDFYAAGSNTQVSLTLGSGGTYSIRQNAAAGSNEVAFFTAGGNVELYYAYSKKFETTSAGVTVTGNLNFTGNLYQNGVLFSGGGGGGGTNVTISDTAPETASSPGSSGEIGYDSDYLYICIAADTWKRTPISFW
ncbi:MAG: hypothetical protein ACO22L_00925 [Candidatus Nanopelagicaceae bacterium]